MIVTPPPKGGHFAATLHPLCFSFMMYNMRVLAIVPLLRLTGPGKLVTPVREVLRKWQLPLLNLGYLLFGKLLVSGVTDNKTLMWAFINKSNAGVK